MNSREDLTVENMFSEKVTSIEHFVSGAALTVSDRKHMLTHVVTDVTARLLSTPGVNPIGVTITISIAEIPGLQGTNLLVTGTAPQYDLSDDFFS